MQKKTVTIYYDSKMVYYHDPNFGSLENGQRVNININEYEKKGCRIVYPGPLKKYKKILKYIHYANPIFKYISSVSLKPNTFEKLLRMEPKSKKIRNCHGCTSETSDNRCKICDTKNDKNKYFRYAFTIDKNICDSDTTYITPTTYTAVKNAVSLVCQMIDDVIEEKTKHGFAIVRPPGHHASHDKSEGFCIVNNIAVCAYYAIVKGFKRIFIFDFDAHHGNGTQNMFYYRSDIFYCSIHTIEAYPKTGHEDEIGERFGQGYNLNVIVPKKVDTETYLYKFRDMVIPAITNYKPDLILVSAGFDGLASDPMALMNLTPECYGEIIKALVEFDIPVCMVLEGGYNIEDLKKCYSMCVDELLNS
ncbi:histone deacetylase [Tupanvirus deep ocean]|uniref:Histone deacetylase n=2 Tax=Tupanvirus TaxID=2094720 RepID=A0AC62A7N2_9VIRU|nr:histone deacetylase [Tupanvirus deep ocean]QKU33688.1 histone deacetylase [Tupanvirus deep ocean]